MTDRSSLRARRAIAAVFALSILVTIGTATSVASAAPEPRADYIVVLREDAAPSAGAVADEHRRNRGADVRRVYEHALKGYAASMTPKQAARLTEDPRVDYVEADQVVHADATQTSPTWGLDRVDERDLPLDAEYSYTSTGVGVKAYIVDTGIYAASSEFTGRLGAGRDFVGGNSRGGDCNGHGTHVAGTVGGTTYGVAKSVTLVPVRVLDCRGSGAWSGVVAGLDWVASDHVGGQPAVANMSLGGGASTAVDDAVRRLIDDGVTVAVAAGNGDRRGVPQNACSSSPARVAEALTVSATDIADKRASFGNYGTCVDLFAPGVNITSSWMGSASATKTISGTSMATPHVAGAAARHLQDNADASPAAVAAAVLGSTTPNKVTNPGSGTPNLLLFTDPLK